MNVDVYSHLSSTRFPHNFRHKDKTWGNLFNAMKKPYNVQLSLHRAGTDDKYNWSLSKGLRVMGVFF
jgi:hypothetical protein